MKYLRRPEITEFPQYLVVKNKEQFTRFDAVWKQIVKEDRARGHTNSNFAPLSILRNLMLGRDIYTGFTPFLRPKCLQNGRNFMFGFADAYRRLYQELGRTSPTHLQSDIHRLLLTMNTFPNIVNLKKTLINPFDFDSSWYHGNYMSRVQKMIISEQEKNVDMSEHTYYTLFRLFEKSHMYNMIRKEDYQTQRFSYDDFQEILNKFAAGWLVLQGKKELVASVDIKEDPSWMYVDADGNDHRLQRAMYKSIVITTKNKYGGETPEGSPYYVPVKHLWELDWLKEFEK